MLSWLTLLDERLFWLINQHHSLFIDRFFLIITNLGNGWFLTPMLVGLILWRLPRRVWLHVIVCGVIALGGSGIVSNVIKRNVERSRPLAHFNVVQTKTVHCAGEKLFARSFPSGHTTTACAAAVFLGMLFGGRWWLSLIAAGLVGYSRVYLGVHFPLDSAAGGMLGALFGWGSVVLFRVSIKKSATTVS